MSLVTQAFTQRLTKFSCVVNCFSYILHVSQVLLSKVMSFGLKLVASPINKRDQDQEKIIKIGVDKRSRRIGIDTMFTS